MENAALKQKNASLLRNSVIGGDVIKIITNGKIITDGAVLDGHCLLIRGTRIEAVSAQPETDLLSDYEVIDAGGAYVSPGFIELHTHGIEGYDFMDNEADGFAAAMKAYAKYGVTGVYPTTLSAPIGELEEVLNGFSEYARREYGGAAFLGVHLEGPYFSPEQCGAQPADFLKPPDAREYRRFAQTYPFLKRWDLAPELEGAHEMARYLTARGIKVGIAHTNATARQVLDAVESGCSIATHLYSGMSGVSRVDGLRRGGAVEGCLLADEVTAELIGDGIHLPRELVRLAYKIKGVGGIVLTTDSMRGAGMPEHSECVLGNRQTGIKTVVRDGVAWLRDRSGFAGSIATYRQLVYNAVNLFDIPLSRAVAMATKTPARAMSLQNKGELRAGFDADVVIFDENIRIITTIVNGKTVYTA